MLSFLIRQNVFILAIALSFPLIVYIYEYDLRKTVIYFIIIFSGFLSLTAIDKIAYSSTEWQTYLELNKAGAELQDYYGIPDYESNKVFYQSINLEKEDVEVLKHSTLILSKRVDGNKLIKVADYARNNSQQFKSPVQCVLDSLISLPKLLSSHNKGMAFLMLLIMIYLLYSIIKYKNKHLLILLTALFAIRISIWLYLLYRGRLPQRVIDSVDLIDISIHQKSGNNLLELTIPSNVDNNLSSYRVFISILGIILGSMFCVNQHIEIKEAINMKESNNSDFQGLLDYFNQNSSNNYFTDINSM